MTSHSVTSALERWSAGDPDASWAEEETHTDPEIWDISEGRLDEDRGILRRCIELVSPTTGRRWRGVASAF